LKASHSKGNVILRPFKHKKTKIKQIEEEMGRSLGSGFIDIEKPSIEESSSFPIADPFKVPINPLREDLCFWAWHIQF
jgi:hypothetical protein